MTPPTERSARPSARLILAGLLVFMAAAAEAAPAKKVIKVSRKGDAAAATPAMQLGDLLFVAGQTGSDASGGRPEAFEAEVKAAFDSARKVLKAGGLDFPSVVNVNVYLSDIASFEAMNGVYRKHFRSNLPARTTIAVPALPGGARFQIAMVASRKPHKAILPKGAKPNPLLPYSPAVLVGDTLYLSGQGSRDASGQLPAGEIEAHTRQALANTLALLEAAGLGPANVVTANVYLKDMALIGRMNEVYKTFFASDPPSRTTVGVPALPGEVPIEITFVASRAPKQVFASEGSKPNLNFSELVTAGALACPAGKVGNGENFEAHTRAAIEGIGKSLAAGKRGLGDVVEAKIYLTDIANRDKALAVFSELFPKDPPALTTTAVSRLVGTSVIEVTLIAAAP